jgi:diguanylate cyclase (GGDEF)-like protein
MVEMGFPSWQPAGTGMDLTDEDARSLVRRSRDSWPDEVVVQPRAEALLLTMMLLSYPAEAAVLEQRGLSWRAWATQSMQAEIPGGLAEWLSEDELGGLLDAHGTPREVHIRARQERGGARWQRGSQEWQLVSAPGLMFLSRALESVDLHPQPPAEDSVYHLPVAQDLVVGVLPRDPEWLTDLVKADPESLPAEAACLDIIERIPYGALLEAYADHKPETARTVVASALRMDRRIGEHRFASDAEAQLSARSDNELNLLSRSLSEQFSGADEIGVYSDVASVLGFMVRMQWTTYQLAAGLCATWTFPRRSNEPQWTVEADRLGVHFARVQRIDGRLQVLTVSPSAQAVGFVPIDRTPACQRFWDQIDQHLTPVRQSEQVEFIAAFGLDRYRVLAQATENDGWAISWRRDLGLLPLDSQPQSDCRVSIDHNGKIVGFTSGFYRLVGTVSIGDSLADVVPDPTSTLTAELIRSAITHTVVEQALPWDRPRYRRWLRARVTRTTHDSGQAVFEATFDTLTGGSRGPRGEFSPLIHDSLTGVYNRHALDALLTLGQEATTDFDGAIYLDVAGFKPINDTYGHHVGDQCLQLIATWLSHECRPGDLVGRPSGDEFVLLCSDVERLVDRLKAWGWRAAQVDDLTIGLGIRLGWSRREPEMSLASAARQADLALTAAKGAGLGAVVRYSEAIRESQRAFVTAQGQLREAMASPHGIRCAFQPIIDVSNGKIIGFESLIRGFADGHHLTADALLDAARQVGVISQVLERAFAEALIEGKRLLEEFTEADLWVNIDRVQLVAAGGLDALVSDISYRGLPLHRMVLEITEQTLNDLDEHEFAESLTRARARGARVAIDDFGQGASNLAAVAQLPIDIVKVDRSLVPHTADDAGWRLVSAVAELGRAFGRTVVVEGIESGVQARQCAELGLTVQQGYLHGRPRAARSIISRGSTPPRPWTLR